MTTKMHITVVSAKYVTPTQIDTTNEPVRGQFVELTLTLTLKNVGKAPAKFSAYGLMTWEDEKTAAQARSEDPEREYPLFTIRLPQ
ncbi:hypothetical protein [Streptomyces sp. NPDC046862]|uniref:hypothetical protein n=1 Tax=Streptomyces sp. NPDC046862 TaxID=3154603 RepID=UPI003454814C